MANSRHIHHAIDHCLDDDLAGYGRARSLMLRNLADLSTIGMFFLFLVFVWRQK
jgi:hypothetical protein